MLVAVALVAGLGGESGYLGLREDLPAPSVTERWSELTATGGELPSGAEITSVVSFDGRFVAAGAYFGSGPDLPAALECPVGCNPTVWTSKDGRRWSPVFAEPAIGGIAGESLVATPVGVFLFDNDEGTAMWRSANGSSWQRPQLPTAMEALGVVGAAWRHGRLVAILNNKYAGSADKAYGHRHGLELVRRGDLAPRPVLGSPRVQLVGGELLWFLCCWHLAEDGQERTVVVG